MDSKRDFIYRNLGSFIYILITGTIVIYGTISCTSDSSSWAADELYDEYGVNWDIGDAPNITGAGHILTYDDGTYTYKAVVPRFGSHEDITFTESDEIKVIGKAWSWGRSLETIDGESQYTYSGSLWLWHDTNSIFNGQDVWYDGKSKVNTCTLSSIQDPSITHTINDMSVLVRSSRDDYDYVEFGDFNAMNEQLSISDTKVVCSSNNK